MEIGNFHIKMIVGEKMFYEHGILYGIGRISYKMN